MSKCDSEINYWQFSGLGYRKLFRLNASKLVKVNESLPNTSTMTTHVIPRSLWHYHYLKLEK